MKNNKLILVFGISIVIVSIVAIRKNNWEKPQTSDKETVILENQVKQNNGTNLLLDLGISYSLDGDKDKAIETYKLALENDPKSVLGWHRLGLVYIETGRFDEALAAMGNTVELEPNEFARHFYYSQILFLYDAEKAIATLKRGVELGKEDVYTTKSTIQNLENMINTFEKYYKTGDLYSAYISLINSENYFDQHIEVELINKLISDDSIPGDKIIELNTLKANIETLIEKGIIE